MKSSLSGPTDWILRCIKHRYLFKTSLFETFLFIITIIIISDIIITLVIPDIPIPRRGDRKWQWDWVNPSQLACIHIVTPGHSCQIHDSRQVSQDNRYWIVGLDVILLPVGRHQQTVMASISHQGSPTSTFSTTRKLPTNPPSLIPHPTLTLTHVSSCQTNWQRQELWEDGHTDVSRMRPWFLGIRWCSQQREHFTAPSHGSTWWLCGYRGKGKVMDFALGYSWFMSGTDPPYPTLYMKYPPVSGQMLGLVSWLRLPWN